MTYTALLRDDDGVRLLEHHVRRLAADGFDPDELREALNALPTGAWTVRVVDGRLDATPREGPGLLADALPSRVVASPFLERTGRFPKPAPPNPYVPLRERGVVTLLCDASLDEVFETSVAMVLAFDGASLVLPPDDRPRVDSTMERAIEAALPFVRRPIRLDAGWSLLAGNATTGVVRVGRPLAESVPAELARALRAVHGG